MNINYHCDELISEIVMKFEETQEIELGGYCE